MAKKTQKKKSRLSSKKKLLILLIGLLLTFFGFQVYRQWQLERGFIKVDKDISMLQAKINEAIPTKNVAKSKHCFRETVKFSEGPLKCSIRLTSSANLIKDDLLLIQNILKNTSEWEETKSANIENIPSSSVNLYKNYNKLWCSSNYSKHTDRLSSFEFHCSVLSKRSFYPYSGD